MPQHTILSHDSALVRELVSVLTRNNQKIRRVSSVPFPITGSENRIADPLDYEALVTALAGSDYVYLLADLSCSPRLWREQLPSVMRNTINACKECRAKLILLDNAHMYGHVTGPVTEETAYQPIGADARLGAQVALMLQREMTEGRVGAVIARTADLYGPWVTSAYTAAVEVFGPLSKGKAPWTWQRPDVPRSLCFAPDAARSLYILATEKEAEGRIWHLPAAYPLLSLREVAAFAAICMGSSHRLKQRPLWLYAISRQFDASLSERHERTQLENYPFHFDSSKLAGVFKITATPYFEGIKETALWFLAQK